MSLLDKNQKFHIMLKRLTCMFFQFIFLRFLHFFFICRYPFCWVIGLQISVRSQKITSNFIRFDPKRPASIIVLPFIRISVYYIRFTKSYMKHKFVVGTPPESEQLVSKSISVSWGWAVAEIDTNTKISSNLSWDWRQKLLWCFDEIFPDRCHLVVLMVPYRNLINLFMPKLVLSVHKNNYSFSRSQVL